MVFVLVLIHALSESCFDAPLPDFSFFPGQAVDIAKWTEDVSGAANTAADFICSSPVLDMNGSEAFELKNDSASVYSMDSAYQSQSGASRNGGHMPEGYQTITPQDARSRVNNNQFLGSDIYSPTLSSENYSTYQEQQTDVGHMQLPSASGDLESGDNSFAYANYTTGQDYAQFTATSIPRFAPSSGIDVGLSWAASESHNFNNPFNFNAYSRSSNSMGAALYSSQDPTELVFNAPAPLQRQSISRPQIDTSARPSIVRKSSSYVAHQRMSRRSSTNDASYGALAMSPVSAISAQGSGLPQQDFERQSLPDARYSLLFRFRRQSADSVQC
jgi:hypothetical protein